MKKLNEGSPVVFPTDTLPALAALPKHSSQLWEIKNRSRMKPLILMGESPKQLFKFVYPNVLEDAIYMANRYWPGPLTMVLPSSSNLVGLLNPGGSSIGLRIPECDLAKKFLAKSGPLATTSANLSGQKPSIDPEEITKCFPGFPLLGPIPWPKSSGLASTVIAWQGPGNWHLIRRGAVIPENLEK